MDLRRTHELCRLLSDGTRLRLLALLQDAELTVGELTELLGLAQSRISTHLGKLREAGLVRVRKNGVGSLYSGVDLEASEAAALWSSVQGQLRDPLLEADRHRAAELIAARAQDATWVDSVAGRMERHYSPGRTWQSMARALLGLLDLGDVLDIGSGDGSLSELLAPRARSVTCLDRNPRVLSAARERLARLTNVKFEEGDLHALPHSNDSFDQVLLMHVLTHAESPEKAVLEAGRVLRRGGDLLLQTLAAHSFAEYVKAYDHIQLGFSVEEIERLVREAGLEATLCQVTHRERRAPHFEVITVHARKR
jgi:ArsR family transcriptional regulator